MNTTDLFYTLALMQVEGVGDIVAKKLINHCGSAEKVFLEKKPKLAMIEGIGQAVIRNLKNKTAFERAEKEVRFVELHNISYCSYQQEPYPNRLKHCLDGPVLLFSRGAIQLSNHKIISIVGTRKITSYGSDFCQKLIADLAPLNPIIVSGFAYGVDIVAHQAAIENKLQTIGVLAHGLNQIYPQSHKKYQAEIEANGGFFTEFWSTSNPDKENFVKRNRIVAGMSEATLVIESANRGGSLITATFASDYNRDVFALPGRATDTYSAGCNNLIKTQRAHLLTSAADLLYILNWKTTDDSPKSIQKQLFVELDQEEQKVVAYLQQKGKQPLDDIALACNFPVFKTSSVLLTMELKGLIRPLPGKLFEAI